MAKIMRRKITWKASTSSDVEGYRLYWAVGGAVDYHSDYADVGNVTDIILPDNVTSFPRIAGDIAIGVTAVNYMGNESDMTKLSASFDFTAPNAPTDLIVEAAEDSSDEMEFSNNIEELAELSFK